jgi:uncharacterized protein (UPF0548 family)
MSGAFQAFSSAFVPYQKMGMGMTTTNNIITRVGGITLLAATGLAGWYLTRRWWIPAQHRTVEVADVPSTPHRLTPQILNAKPPVQLLKDGVGPLFHRQYYANIEKSTLTETELIQKIVQDINRCCPTEMANFEKTKGSEKQLAVGDEFFIHLTGPWNGPIRVIEVKPNSFSFITLEGHLEAGEIQFRVVEHPTKRNAYRFEIRSWSRSIDKVVDFAYDTLPLVKTAQAQMWVYFCKQVVDLSGGELIGEIQVITEETDFHPSANTPMRSNSKNAPWKQYESHLNQLREAQPNYDLSQRETFTKVNGWNVDDYLTALPPETPGEPTKGGSWELAKAVLYNYEFPPPDLIEGIFIPDDPLDKRVMVLKAKFLFFSFYFGVRISHVMDEYREEAGRGKAKVWGYGYQTLEGHWEMGEILFEVWKFLQSGEVELRIHAYSKTGKIPNPFYRLGFRLFGRSLQVRFAQQALKRVNEFVVTRLEQGKQAQPLEKTDVLPTSADAKAEKEAESV